MLATITMIPLLSAHVHSVIQQASWYVESLIAALRGGATLPEILLFARYIILREHPISTFFYWNISAIILQGGLGGHCLMQSTPYHSCSPFFRHV